MNEPTINKLTTDESQTPESQGQTAPQIKPIQEDKGESLMLKKLPQESKSAKIKTVFFVFVIILAGIGSGYLLSLRQSAKSSLKTTQTVTEEGVKVGDVFGSADEKTFRDQSEGVLVTGGIDGEGSHHLLRPGDKSQNVYLTSSVVDLDLFLDDKVKVWGETFKAQQAGWLMDVGRVEVLELNAQKPFEE